MENLIVYLIVVLAVVLLLKNLRRKESCDACKKSSHPHKKPNK